MTKMFFSSPGCLGATSGTTGREYHTDKKSGLIDVRPEDVKSFKDGGYVIAGSVRTAAKHFWTCDSCSWDANINSCPKCGSESLRRVEKLSDEEIKNV